MTVIPPGATIGFLGGGQLGRMTALAARSMGYRVHVLDPDANCSAAPVADRCVAARFDDVEAARELARHCDVITLEIEQIATYALNAAREYAPTRPGAHVIGIVQDRARQKEWLVRHGFPVGPFRNVLGPEDIAAAAREFEHIIVKSCHGGYDGRSQTRVSDEAHAQESWAALGKQRSIAEKTLSLAGEMSVMVARRPGGETVVYPAALNHHEGGVLAWSVLPAPVPQRLVDHATEIGRGIAETLGVEGLIAVELFITTDGELLVNELAPRPHNSYHASERACVTGQFEQLTRAVCDLPLGDPGVIRPGAIVNLFGDIWNDGREPDFASTLTDTTVRVHLYGKAGARPGRKMGHISALGATPFDALATARAAARRVGAETEDVPGTVLELSR